MDVAQLQQEIQDHGYGSDTAAQQLDFLNAAYREIHRARRWPFLEAIDSSTTTSVNVSSYTPPMSNWRNLDAVRLVDPTNAVDYIQMSYMEPQALFDKLTLDSWETATPRYWTMYAQEIWFWPIPDQAYTIKYYYIQEPPALVSSTDVPVVPVAYHDLLVSGAIVRIAFRERDWIGLELWTAKYNKDMQDLEEEYLIKQRQSSSRVKRSGFWNTEVAYPLSSTGF